MACLLGCRPANLPSRELQQQSQAAFQQLHRFTVEGKVAYRKANRGGSALLYWQQANQDYLIKISSPFSSDTLTLQGHPGHVVLTQANGQILHAKTPEVLMSQLLGWELPVSQLLYWIRGTTPPSTSGWQLEYQDIETIQGRPLPTKLNLKNGDLHIKLVFQRWQF